MIDHFTTLGQPRRPWLDAEVLKDTFHRLSASLHPDVPGTGDAAKFAALNAAYSILRDPAPRLRHLLELTAPEALAAAVAPPPELGDLFMEIAGLRRRLDDFFAKKNAATSPLARALLAGDEAALRRDLAAAQARLDAADSAALAEVRVLDEGGGQVESLMPLYHRLSYLGRWRAQIREALFSIGV